MKHQKFFNIAAIAVCGSAILAGCSSTEGHTAASPHTVAAATQTAVAAPDSEQALRKTMDDSYKAALQTGDFGKYYDYLSPRCQARTTSDELGSVMRGQYKGRDFSGPETYLITMHKHTATVVIKSFDGKGKMTPATWSFIDGRWTDDDC